MLDLGSGGGIDVLLSARRVGPTGKAYGLDMTDEMLALASMLNGKRVGYRERDMFSHGGGRAPHVHYEESTQARSWIDDIDGNRSIGVKLLDAHGWFAE